LLVVKIRKGGVLDNILFHHLAHVRKPSIVNEGVECNVESSEGEFRSEFCELYRKEVQAVGVNIEELQDAPKAEYVITKCMPDIVWIHVFKGYSYRHWRPDFMKGCARLDRNDVRFQEKIITTIAHIRSHIMSDSGDTGFQLLCSDIGVCDVDECSGLPRRYRKATARGGEADICKMTRTIDWVHVPGLNAEM
jgi:hypothetical protein